MNSQIEKLTETEAYYVWSLCQNSYSKISKGLVYKYGGKKALLYINNYCGHNKTLMHVKDKIRLILTETDIQAQIDQIEKNGVHIICPSDKHFPQQIKDLSEDSPIVLYVKGCYQNLNQIFDKCVSIVGTRNATYYGLKMTRTIVEELAQNGYSISSGGAFGIDQCAHRTMIDYIVDMNQSNANIAFLACGANAIYPSTAQPMFDKLLETNGAIITEYPPNTSPKGFRFLERNRLIGVFSKATVVVEAPWRSGALSTASVAKNYLRSCGAVPGSADSFNSSGCHKLIKQGADLVTCADDIIKLMSNIYSASISDINNRDELCSLDEVETIIYNNLTCRYQKVETIMNFTKLDYLQTKGVLASLILKGLVEQKIGCDMYKRAKEVFGKTI